MTLHLEDELRNNGGFTYDPRTNELVRIGTRDGYAIAIPGTEIASDPDALHIAVEYYKIKHAAALTNPDIYIGGWHSDDRGIDVIELTEIVGDMRDEAIEIGQERNQEGILDMRTGEFIPTGGSGAIDRKEEL